jgi:hypothetical protein
MNKILVAATNIISAQIRLFDVMFLIATNTLAATR